MAKMENPFHQTGHGKCCHCRRRHSRTRHLPLSSLIEDTALDKGSRPYKKEHYSHRNSMVIGHLKINIMSMHGQAAVRQYRPHIIMAFHIQLRQICPENIHSSVGIFLGFFIYA
ncbi:MAG TPA: hypothetical protein DCZ40_03080 [Lachnospiraceae bacterium]|nr:hypothetical protein [Lachnospiraceae bacterium]